MKNIIILLLIAIVACDETAEVKAQGEPVCDAARTCLYCGGWKIESPFSSNNITSGTYTIAMKAVQTDYSYPHDTGITVSLYNNGDSEITVIVTEAAYNKGMHTLKPNQGVQLSNLFKPDAPAPPLQSECEQKSYLCYYSPVAEVAVRFSISGSGAIAISASAGAVTCNGNDYDSKTWNLNLN